LFHNSKPEKAVGNFKTSQTRPPALDDIESAESFQQPFVRLQSREDNRYKSNHSLAGMRIFALLPSNSLLEAPQRFELEARLGTANSDLMHTGMAPFATF
jgi:hypothetical protein